MDCIIVSVDVDRYRAAESRLKSLGLFPCRWKGYTPDDLVLGKWLGPPLRDAEKKQAIVHTYRALFESLKGDGPWFIIQDDVELNEMPVHDKPLTLHSGAHLYTMRPSAGGWYRPKDSEPFPVDPWGGHVCPVAFSIDREAVDAIVPMLEDDRQICVQWAKYINPETTSFGKVIARERSTC